MHARVARFEGGQADALRENAEQIGSNVESDPPEGVPAKGFVLLIGPDNGRGLAITPLETEDDLRQGEEVLSAMTRPQEGPGSRTSLETYEVAVDARL